MFQESQPSGSRQSGLYMLVARVQLPSSAGWGPTFWRTAQSCASNCSVYPFRRNWQSWIYSSLEPALWDSGRPRRLKPLFYKQETGTGKGLCTWESPAWFQSSLLGITLDPVGNRGRIKRGTRFWAERLIANPAEEPGFRGTWLSNLLLCKQPAFFSEARVVGVFRREGLHQHRDAG